ncbi:MAG: hypothetical protein KC776_29635 [Myxococcales bacterium]|nr:hypothetical protein [Myxococcales bacterium]MCB9576409.1 hypothetical protein [Polyangiaceae bacterium]
MPDERDILDERDDDARDDAGLSRRLQRVLVIQQKVTRRLNAIASVWNAPGPPDAPRLLADLISEAQAAIAVAEDLQRQTRS